MNSHEANRSPRILFLRREHVVAIFAGAAVLLLALSYFAGEQAAFNSSEVQFTDEAPSGLVLIPASCPSDPHSTGECTPPTTSLTQTLSSTAAGEAFTVTYGRSGGGSATSCVLERYQPGTFTL